MQEGWLCHSIEQDLGPYYVSQNFAMCFLPIREKIHNTLKRIWKELWPTCGMNIFLSRYMVNLVALNFLQTQSEKSIADHERERERERELHGASGACVILITPSHTIFVCALGIVTMLTFFFIKYLEILTNTCNFNLPSLHSWGFEKVFWHGTHFNMAHESPVELFYHLT